MEINRSMILSVVPKIDRLAGIECYCTDLEGIEGSIKQDSEDFVVSEIVNKSLYHDLVAAYQDDHRYPVYVLEKRNIDSNHALIEIQNELHINLKVMGIKDARAVTRQYASLNNVPGNEKRRIPEEATTRHTHITLIGFARRPLHKALLIGNEFTITIYNQRSAKVSLFVPQLSRIGNFYGLQRFGSERLVTHLVGKEIVKRNFRVAVELLLSHTTENDTPMRKEIRNGLADPRNYPQLLERLPHGMDIEYQVMSAKIDGKGDITALRSIPITIRRLFVQAYQSYIFNRCLSQAIINGENITAPLEGDLCFEMEGTEVFGRIRKFDPNGNVKMVPAVRMAGYTFQPGSGRFENFTKSILQQEGVTSKDFYIKEMEELSQQGGFRQAPLCCRNFSFTEGPLKLSFGLPKGSYATTLLRELLKPNDPIRCGF